MPYHRIGCCVRNCAAVDMTMHRFPNIRTHMDIYNLWIDALEMEELRDLDPAFVYQNRRVCFSHFEPKHKSPGNPRLHKNAVPSLNLPTAADSENMEHLPVSTVSPPRSIPVVVQEPPIVLPAAAADSENMEQLPIPIVTPPRSIPEDVFQEPPIDLQAGTSASVSLLKSVSTTYAKDLTPKARSLYDSAKYWKRAAFRAKVGRKNFKDRLAAAEEMAESPHFRRMGVLTPAAQTFFDMQYCETGRHPRARRFTKEEKIMCITLFKKSPKSYSLLQKLFTLPSEKTLTTFLSNTQLRPGINKHLFSVLEQNVRRMKPEYRVCVVLFDEVAISAHLDYNPTLDEVEGFVDNGVEKEKSLADHSLVFMVRGIIKQWKQPVVYSFCKSTTKSDVLSVMIKDVVGELLNIGLTVLATVCDQAKTNEAAIKSLALDSEQEKVRLGQNYRTGTFDVKNESIIPLFDVPHLIKGIRNNLLKKDLRCIIKGRPLVAKWKHINQLYNLDKKKDTEDLRLLPKLKDAHINPDNREKMRVKLATQVFSQRVASIMNYIAATGADDLEAEAVQTAEVFLFFDKLFDSLNSSTRDGVEGKPLTASLSETSEHVVFWIEAVQILKTMKFCSVDNVFEVPPTIRNFQKTVSGVLELWNTIKKMNVTYLYTRNLNQDPLENYFGLVRSHGVTNDNPTPANFAQTYKTLTINNFTAKHSIGGNCEKDFSESLLGNLQRLIVTDVQKTSPVIHDFAPILVNINETFLTNKLSNYCMGFILKPIKNIVKTCENCKPELIAAKRGLQHGLIQALEYDEHQRLIYPSFSAARCFVEMKKIIFHLLSTNLDIKNLFFNIKEYVKVNVNFDFITCIEHRNQIIDTIIKKCVALVSFYYIKDKNLILNGKKRIEDNMNLDYFQRICKERFEKTRKYKK